MRVLLTGHLGYIGSVMTPMLQQAGVKAKEAIFVDDVAANIDACEKVGMKGILFKEPQEVLAQLNRLLKIKK